MARSPYAGRRPATASVPRFDEERFIARYEATGNVSRCAREFGIGRRRAQLLLERKGVLPKDGQQPTADEGTVLRAFGKLGSVNAVTKLHDVAEPDVRAILDRRDVARDSHGPLLTGFDGKSRARRKARRRLASEPSPGDLLWPSEAVRLTGVRDGSLLADRLPNRGSQYFARYRRDEVVALRDALCGTGGSDDTSAS